MTVSMPTTTSEIDLAGQADARPSIGALEEIMAAYNAVTERLSQNHERLTLEVGRLRGELNSANAALQRSRRLAALGEMAAGIAHEVRNPLVSIRLYAEMLRDDLGGMPEQQDLASKIAQAVRELDGVVTDVLMLSRELRIRPRPVRMEELLEQALEAVRPMVEQAGVQATINAPDIEAELDPGLIRQAIVNLIRNGVEAMAERGGGRLQLLAERDREMVRIVVRDSGPGIPQEAIDRIFNPFFSTRETGTGLGLSIVHRIVEAHGGTIEVHNESGAVFTLTLAARRPPAGEARAATEA